MSEGFEVASGAIGELFWNVADAVFVCDHDRVLAWNHGAEDILGVLGPAMGPDTDLRPALGQATEGFWDLVRAGSGEALLECDHGSERILQATAWRLVGHPVAPTVVVLRDVTEEHRQAAGLQRLNGLARELLGEPSLDVLLVRIVDAAKDLLRADFSALLLLRQGSPDEVAHFVYNAPRELFPTRLPRAVGLLAVPLTSRAVTRLADIRGHPAGVGIPVEHPPIAALLAAPVLLDDQVVGELAVANSPGRPAFDDVDEAMITELAAHAALAMSLASARSAQEQLDANRRALLDVALHNIRTPLTVAKGFLATLRSHGGSLSQEEWEGAFEAVERAHERIQALAEGALLDDPLTHPDAPARPAELIHVADLVEELRAGLEDVRPDVVIEVSVEPGAPASFPGDRRLVRELLENLVTNALKHSPAGQPVTVTARAEGGSVRFDVSDQGPGIPPEEQARVFEQFYRTRQSVTGAVPGTGLGLWVARRLADLQGGALGVSSRTGQGTTFWATFPLEPPQPTALAPA